MITIFLVDDHTVLRQGLHLILEEVEDMKVVGEAGTGADALNMIPAADPDVVLLDIHLPDMSGVEVAKGLKARGVRAHIIILTVSDRHHDLVEAIRAGARGYLLKSSDAEQVIHAIRQVNLGGTVLPPNVVQRAFAAAHTPPSHTSNLTEREVEVLRLIARGLGNKEIAARLSLSENTVKTHVRNILSKLNARSRAEAAAYAAKIGLISNGE